MQIGILGGSFNPPHLAHALIAVLYLKANPKAKVWVIPCYAHPFAKQLAPFKERLAMTRLTFKDLGQKIMVKDLEKNIGGVNYTAKTIRYLKRTYPKNNFELIIGSDNQSLKGWKEKVWLKKNIPLFVVPRGLKNKENFGLANISSSQIRKLAAKNKDLSRLVAKEVAAYLETKNLYN